MVFGGDMATPIALAIFLMFLVILTIVGWLAVRVSASEPKADTNHIFAIWVAGTALAFIGFATTGVALLLDDGPQWAPLGEYPIQQVEGTLELADSAEPAIRLGEEIIVTATKCLKLNIVEPVQVRAELSFVIVEPQRSVADSISGVGTREPGCTDFEFVNPVPEIVEETIQTRLDRGAEYVVMQLTGREVPFNEDGDGIAQTFRTVRFRVYPSDFEPAG